MVWCKGGLIDTQTSIFDEYIKRKSLFKNKEALSTTYVPQHLPHRDMEIDFLAQELSGAFKEKCPSNLLIYGATGTGKTAVVRYIGKEIEKTVKNIKTDTLDNVIRNVQGSLDKIDNAKKEGHKIDYWIREYGGEIAPVLSAISSAIGPEAILGKSFREMPISNVNFIYINCQHVDTEYRVLTNIANHFADKWMETVPFTGLHVDEVYKRLLEFLDRDCGITIIVLDEIDRLVYKNGDDVLYGLTRINSDLENMNVSLIGISNDLNFTQFLEPRVLSSLGVKETVFPPYNAEQLQDILRERTTLAFEQNAIGEGVIELCSALAAAEHGDARRALDILRVSAEVCEQRNADCIMENHVRTAMSKIEKDKVTEVLKTLPIQSKLVLLAITHLQEKGTKRTTTGEVYTRYRELCGLSGFPLLGQRRVTDLISELDMLGLIRAKIISFGRGGGRTKVIDTLIPMSQLREAFEDDEALRVYLGLLKVKRRRE